MRSGDDRVLDQPVEKHSAVLRSPAVVAERVLVEVVVEVGGLPRALVGAQEPALGERDDAVNVREQLIGGLAGALDLMMQFNDVSQRTAGGNSSNSGRGLGTNGH